MIKRAGRSARHSLACGVRKVVVLTSLLAFAPVVAHAQVVSEPAPPPWPDAKKFAKGLFVSGELGALVFFGRIGQYASPGPAFGVRIGYDILRWLDVQAHVMGAAHDATTPPPTHGQSFQTLLYSGEVRLKLAIRRFQLFAEGGAGLGQVTSNVLAQSGATTNNLSFAAIAGVGLDYHTLNRHFSFGVSADYLWFEAWRSASSGGAHALTANAYLRYTR